MRGDCPRYQLSAAPFWKSRTSIADVSIAGYSVSARRSEFRGIADVSGARLVTIVAEQTPGKFILVYPHPHSDSHCDC